MIMGSIISLSIIFTFIYAYSIAEKVISKINKRIQKYRTWNKFDNFGKKY